ncbi:ribonuclease R [Parvularcula sp. LCG005]|uniref:ribonuclease R n=1 Tax=Parvularcula sp. LCG005 TaxID=3078805 RepID=UPI002941D97B|nr:ribonuclease R [Parvularcula sp. LCG005]WOI54526.1 ribonuclease R [Parvularcula sp. LCG005]
MTKLPTKKQLTDYIASYVENGDGPPARRDIAKAFHVKGPDRTELRRLLKALEDEGAITLEGKRANLKNTLPPISVMDVVRSDKDGDLICEPVLRDFDGPLPDVLLTDSAASKVKPPLGVGMRFLGKIIEQEDGRYTAQPMKVLNKSAQRTLGVYTKGRKDGRVEPVGRKGGSSFVVSPQDAGDAEDGDLVWIEAKNDRGYGPRRARVREVVGDIASSQNWSLIALAEQEIPVDFPAAVVREAEAQTLPRDSQHHEDIRDLPLITIDPADAKDHDDAVYAERHKDGWKITVAIADVSWFVRPGSALDKEAQRRGNSVYLVDRVVPMLPEVLSNGLCSLKAGEDRTALCCEMIYNDEGRKTGHRFYRGLMRSKAGISYEEAEAAHLGELNDRTAPIKDSIIDPLYAAYETMLKGRNRRAPLNLELPERKIVLDDSGQVASVQVKERLEAHKLIEVMMVAANVCAAESLEEARRPLIYRVHDEPDPERLEALRQYLSTMDYSLPKGQVIKPESFNRVLAMAQKRDQEEIVSMAILRTQSQAVYDTDNGGHFGLHLMRYAHFTSPIRRYADLTVHRGLVGAFKLGPGAATKDDEKDLTRTAELITGHERRAVNAERSTQDRFLAAYLEDEVGADFPARISGATRAGLFVALNETGADGFIPMRTLTGDYYEFDEAKNALVGQRTRGRYAVGQKVMVRLVEVTPVQGGMRFEMLTDSVQPDGDEGSERPKRGAKPKRKAAGPKRASKDKGKRRVPSTRREDAAPSEQSPRPAKRQKAAKNATAAPPSATSESDAKTLRRRPRKKPQK